MRRLAQFVCTAALMAGAAFGQRPGGPPPGNPVPLGNRLPPISPIPPFDVSQRSAAPQFAPQFAPRRRARSAPFYSSPYYPGLPYYPVTYSAPVESAPGVTIIQQFAPSPAPAAPAEGEEPAVTPVIHEYSAPAAPSPEAEPATFAIVLKDGKMLSAAAVSVQGGALQIVDPDGEHQRVPLDTIDRETTRRRNAERNLRLQLPAPAVP